MAGEFSIDLKTVGLAQLERRLGERVRLIPGVVAAALYVEAWEVMRQALKRVPVDTGALRRSHFVARPTMIDGRASIRLGFVAPYATFVHENLRAKHINGSAKFLEIPMAEAQSNWAALVGDRAAHMLQSGTGIDQIPQLGPTAGEFLATGAKSRHRGRGAAARDRKARKGLAERIAQRATRDAGRGGG